MNTIVIEYEVTANVQRKLFLEGKFYGMNQKAEFEYIDIDDDILQYAKMDDYGNSAIIELNTATFCRPYSTIKRMENRSYQFDYPIRTTDDLRRAIKELSDLQKIAEQEMEQ